jgi:hypothetical protein
MGNGGVQAKNMSQFEVGLELDGPDIDVDQAEEHGIKNTGNSCYV